MNSTFIHRGYSSAREKRPRSVDKIFAGGWKGRILAVLYFPLCLHSLSLFPRYPFRFHVSPLSSFFPKCSQSPSLGILFPDFSSSPPVCPEELPVSDTRLLFNYYSSSLFSLTFLRINDDLLDCNPWKESEREERSEGAACVETRCRLLSFSMELQYPRPRRKSRESFDKGKVKKRSTTMNLRIRGGKNSKGFITRFVARELMPFRFIVVWMRLWCLFRIYRIHVWVYFRGY